MAEQLPHLDGVLQDKLIEVADYQRPYAWTEKQLRDLWQDLDLMGLDHHYSGTLVLQRTDSVVTSHDGKDLTRYEVVDGQQRLTTCIILLDQLQRAMQALAHHDLDDLDLDGAQQDLKRLIKVNIGGVSTPRLKLGTDFNDFFADSILGDQPVVKNQLSAGERRLQAAAQFFRDQIVLLLEGVDEAEGARRLIELRARVCFRLRFLVYEVESSAEVGVLFETLNDRGQPLSELEKVKNYLLYLSRQVSKQRSEHLAKQINQAWSEIFSNMSLLSIDDDALLRAHWVATEDPVQRNWERTASVKKKFPRNEYVPRSGRLTGGSRERELSDDVSEKLFTDVGEYIQTLRYASAYLRDIYDPQARYESFSDERTREKIRRQSLALVRSGSVANFRPLLIACRLAFPTDGELYLQILELCEKFSARAYVICVVRSNAGQSKLYRAAFNLFKGYDSTQTVMANITDHLLRLAPDDAVRMNLGPNVEWYYRRSHKYVLYEYELSAVRTSSELPTWGELTTGGSKTTEHILPQTPKARSQWRKDFTTEEHARLQNTLGNLVLTRDNSFYSNKDYKLKRGEPRQESPPCYFSLSAFAREKEIAQQFEVWTPETIEQRRQAIEEWALQRWRVDPPNRANVTDVGDDPEDDAAEENHL